jgi:CheY-like chemotaxis protein
MNRLVASNLLLNYEAVILEACNGQEVIEVLQSTQIDLILMDIQMPVLNGYDATKYIRNELKNAIPIIALTANALKGEMQKCMDAGMDDFITKPYNEDDFIRTIIKQLGKLNAGQTVDRVKEKTKLYDLSNLNDICRNDKAFVKKMVHLFIQQASLAVEDIKNEYGINHLVKVKDIAHKIKPSIDSMGISLLTSTIREIENLAQQGDSSNKLPTLINDLEVIQYYILIINETF